MNQNKGNPINLYAYGGLGWVVLYELKKPIDLNRHSLKLK